MTIVPRTAAGFALVLWLVPAFLSAQPARSCCNSPGLSPAGSAEPELQDLPGAGQTCRIGEVNSFVYEFDKTPGMGTVILKIRLFDKDGRQVSDLEITGRSDTPSLRGAHDSGDVPLKLDKRGDYLLPVDIVMPGDWEVLLTFSRNKIVIFRGRLTFGV
jgi:hypothetical protein